MAQIMAINNFFSLVACMIVSPLVAGRGAFNHIKLPGERYRRNMVWRCRPAWHSACLVFIVV